MFELLANVVTIIASVLGLVQSDPGGAICPYCKAKVRSDAQACPHCGRSYV